MNVVVLGGTGLIGSKVVRLLKEKNHDVLATSSSTVDLLTGRGIDAALQGAEIVVDLTNSPSFEDSAVMNFFKVSAQNLFPAEAAAGVKHHVALSIVGADRMVDIGYMRAKVAQEKALEAAGVPYTIVRATQFFEFISSLVDGATVGQTVRLSNVMMQPIAADDIAGIVANIALQTPANGRIDVAGPDRRRIDDLAKEFLEAKSDPRTVECDPTLGYFGGQVPENSLVPEADARLGTAHFSDWLKRTQPEG
jgi:uncharacterized protein YbjT (DUF2867 family)